MSARILVIEDDPAISFGLKTNLAFEGYAAEVADSREAVQRRVGPGPGGEAPAPLPDLIVLDLMLPDGTGFEVMDDLRRAGYSGLVLVLSARKEETDKVTALRMGADDYVTKPFSLAELLARIEALLRRGKGGSLGLAPGAPPAAPAGVTPVAAGAEAQRIKFGRCEIDVYSRTLRVDLEAVQLTRLEFDLLLYLAQHPGQALSRGQLLRDVWGLQHEGSARTVDNVIAHLRTKIGEDADRPRHLRTLRGAGYRFTLEAEER